MTIPDPDIMTRPFLAIALNELDPTIILPHIEQSIKEVAEQFENYERNPMKEYTNAVRDFVKNQKLRQQTEARSRQAMQKRPKI
jgi:ATPase subunit of ABC transporter with duplicated ATPase domains